MSTLGELGEFEVIRRLTAARSGAGRERAFAADPRAGVVVGSGDDAAVLRPAPGSDLVATTDAFVEGGHFLRDWCPARVAGARLAQANLSDLAAMAAVPRWALLSIGARPESEVADLVAFQSGLSEALEAAGAVLVGGNLTAVAGAEWYSLTLLGECERGREWTRFGARPGDLVAVSGHPGRAGAGARARPRAGRGRARAAVGAAPRSVARAGGARDAGPRPARDRGGDGGDRRLGRFRRRPRPPVRVERRGRRGGRAGLAGRPAARRRRGRPRGGARGAALRAERRLRVAARRGPCRVAPTASEWPRPRACRWRSWVASPRRPVCSRLRAADGAARPLDGAGYDHFGAAG